MISSHRIPPIAIYVSNGHSTSASFGKGEEVDEKAIKTHRKESVLSKK